jgi:hypothetical protein
VVFTDAVGPKLSTILLKFIEPYKKDAPTREAYERLIAITIISWNAAILQGRERQELIDTNGKEWQKEMEDIIGIMIRRKEAEFAGDKRFIVDYRLSETETEYHLSVASVLKD